MPASLITLIGPAVDAQIIASLEATLPGALSAPPTPGVGALNGLEVRQWHTESPVAQARAALSDFAASTRALGVEVLVTPAHLAEPGPRLVVTDVDSTLILDEVIELLADHAGSRDEVEAVTEAAMRGELDFTQSLIQRVATLRGLDSSVYEAVLTSLRLSAGVENLCRTLKSSGDFLGVVSGGFIEVVQPLADGLGIDFARANELEIEGGKLTGRVSGTVVDREVKAETLRAWAGQCGVPIERTIAIGDGANDLAMLAAAGLGVAFNAKPVVAAQADTAIVGKRIDVILAALGA